MVLVPLLGQGADVPYAYAEDCTWKNAVSVADLEGTDLKFTNDFENSFKNYRGQSGSAEERFQNNLLLIRP